LSSSSLLVIGKQAQKCLNSSASVLYRTFASTATSDVARTEKYPEFYQTSAQTEMEQVTYFHVPFHFMEKKSFNIVCKPTLEPKQQRYLIK